MTKRLRVGVIGGGGIAQMMHLPHLAERPDKFELVALADMDARTLEEVGAKYRIPNLTTNASELIAREDVDAVLIFASGNHRAVVLEALASGKHVLCEKPVAYNVAEAEEVARAVKGAKGTFMAGYHKRFDPHYRRARELVRSMGDLRYVAVTVLHPEDGAYRMHHVVWPDPDSRTRLTPEADDKAGALKRVTSSPTAKDVDGIVPAGAPSDHRVASILASESLIHDINAVRGVLGEPEEVISAHVWQDGWAQTSVTRFPNDVRVNMSWISVPGLKHYEETIRFIGPKLRVTLVFPSPYLRNLPTELLVERGEGPELVQERHTLSFDEAFRDELEHFRVAVTTGQKPELTEADVLGDARWLRDIAAKY
ncbi:MAG: Gfo/Idh/MocA family oxidoreductase [Polyangiales bacterium]|nr:Gfo/Idh/MocA family oxidoreductase [Myxococcales bacterium]